MSPTAHPASRTPSQHAYLPGSLQFDMNSPTSTVRQVDPFPCRSPAHRNTRSSRGRQGVSTKISHPACPPMTSPDEVSRHSRIHDSGHIREIGPSHGKQSTLAEISNRNGGLGLACQQLRRHAWRVPKLLIHSLAPQRTKNDDNSPLLNPDAIRGRRSLNMLELTVARDDDCFRDDDGNEPKRDLSDGDAEDPFDDTASDSALVGSPASAWSQRMHVLSPSNAKHSRRFDDKTATTRPPLPVQGKQSSRRSF